MVFSSFLLFFLLLFHGDGAADYVADDDVIIKIIIKIGGFLRGRGLYYVYLKYH